MLAREYGFTTFQKGDKRLVRFNSPGDVKGMGVLIENAPSNAVGGPAPNAGNVIAGNSRDGVAIENYVDGTVPAAVPALPAGAPSQLCPFCTSSLIRSTSPKPKRMNVALCTKECAERHIHT